MEFWRLWSLGDVWLENRGGSLGSAVEVTLDSPSGLRLLLLSLQKSEQVLTHVLTTRSLPCWGGLRLEAKANLSFRELSLFRTVSQEKEK